MVDVAHNGHHRCPRQQIAFFVFDAHQAFFDVGFRHPLERVAHLFNDDLCGIGIDQVVDGVHLALLHQELDDVDRPFGHPVGEFLNGDRFGNGNLAGNLLCRRREA